MAELSQEQMRQYAASLLAPRHAHDQYQIWFNRVDGKETIKELMLLIAGVEIEYTENGNAVLRETKNQTMTLEGASKLHIIIRNLINPVTALTRFNENEILHHTRVISNEIRIWLTLNYQKYRMDKEFVQALNESINVTVHAQLNRGLNGMEADLVSVDQSRLEQRGRMESETRDLRKHKPEVLR